MVAQVTNRERYVPGESHETVVTYEQSPKENEFKLTKNEWLPMKEANKEEKK